MARWHSRILWGERTNRKPRRDRPIFSGPSRRGRRLLLVARRLQARLYGNDVGTGQRRGVLSLPGRLHHQHRRHTEDQHHQHRRHRGTPSELAAKLRSPGHPHAPSPGSTTTYRRPSIVAKVADIQADLAAPNMMLYLDGRVIEPTTFAYDPSKDRLSYWPASALSYGRHTVRVVAEDTSDVGTTKEWCFRVVRP